MDEYLHILARRVEHFGHRGIGQQHTQRREIETVGDRIDNRDLGLAGELHEAKLRIICAFPHELSIDRNELFAGEPLAKRCQGLGVRDDGWRGEAGFGGSDHQPVFTPVYPNGQ